MLAARNLQDLRRFRGWHGQHRRRRRNAVAKMYFDDGSIERGVSAAAGVAPHHAERRMGGQRAWSIPTFGACSRASRCSRATGMRRRLAAKQTTDRKLWRRHVDYLDKFLKRESHVEEARRLRIPHRLARARKTLEEVESPDYLKTLSGTIGAEPIDVSATRSP